MKTQYIREVVFDRESVDKERWKTYPFTIPVVHKLETIELHPKVTFLIGENGSGKSTLLEAIAVAYGLNAEGGSHNQIFSTRDTHSQLHDHLTLVKGVMRPKDKYFLRAESYYNVATQIDDLDSEPSSCPPIKNHYGGTSLHEQSHGESFFALFQNRLFGDGLYILDEPEAALSPRRQMSMLARMHELIEKHSQFIIATHSPILLSYPHAKIIECNESGYEEKTYEETECYKLYQTFIDNPERMLNHLGIRL